MLQKLISLPSIWEQKEKDIKGGVSIIALSLAAKRVDLMG